MDYKVVLAPRAIDDLRDIVLYVAPDRPEAAKRLGFALIEKTKVLGSFPLCGQVVPEFGDPLIRELILKPYRGGLGWEIKTSWRDARGNANTGHSFHESAVGEAR